MEPLKPTYFYLRRDDGHPIGVVALRREAASSVTIAASLCSPEDAWDRTAGINKAVGKLNSKAHSTELTFRSFALSSDAEMRPGLAKNILCKLLRPQYCRDGPIRVESPVIRHGVDLELAQEMLVKQIRWLLTPRARTA